MEGRKSCRIGTLMRNRLDKINRRVRGFSQMLRIYLKLKKRRKRKRDRGAMIAIDS